MLREYLWKVSGCRLMIDEKANPPMSFIAIWEADDVTKQKEMLSTDGFVLSTRNHNIFIESGGGKGSIYGVVEFLERYLGCRMYAPGVEKVPKSASIIIPPMYMVDNPANSFRVVHGTFNQDSLYRDWQRLNSLDEMFAKGYYVHTFNRLVPWETYFSAHPEYYSFMNGKRIKDQLCLTNENVYNIVLEKLKTEMALQPDKKVWSVSQNDNFSYCQCENCMKIIREEGSPAGPVIRFVNRLAAEFPDKVISTLAYQFSRQAPKVTKPLQNVQIMLCTIELNRSKPIEQDPTSTSFLKDIEDWGKIASNIYLWDYTVNFSHSTSPFPNLHVLQPNIQFLTRNGAHQHFQQSNTGVGHEMSELKSYLISRLLWNPNINTDSVISDFVNGYFEEAAPSILQYIQRLTAEIQKTGEWLDIYGHPVAHAKTFLSDSNMVIYNRLFDDAEASVVEKPDILQRVKIYRLPIQYAAIEIGKNDMFGPRGFYAEKNGLFELRAGMKKLVDDFYGTCKNNKVSPLNESGLTAEEYYNSTKRFIEVQVEGNHAFRKKVTSQPLPAAKYGEGDLTLLTNGVKGANDYKAHWLGWEAKDFTLTLDLGEITEAKDISISTLYDPKSWILHPTAVNCFVSADGAKFQEIGKQLVTGDQKSEDVTRDFYFLNPTGKTRFVKFSITGTKTLPAWHPSAGGDSWVFVDEIVVR
ncbi:MAG TPA: DUF4838 domain-containing protein, partial [Bacteroidales bacterium]|nr:DUF4838 domain-containing protein [Bacteroidales bacterium]